MKTLILLILLSTPTTKARWEILSNIENKKASIFINAIWEDAIFVQENYQIPAALCIAQAIQESGFGTSHNAAQRCNFFGVRRGGKYVEYNCKRESFNDYGATLNLDCYGKPKNLAEWFDALECCGYAGDKGYTKRLKRIIEKYKLYLI